MYSVYASGEIVEMTNLSPFNLQHKMAYDHTVTMD